MKRPRRWQVMLFIGLCLIFVAFSGIELWVRRPVGDGPAGPPVADEPFASVWSDRPVRVVGLGDSVTAGFGAKSVDRAYFNRVVQNPDDEFVDMQGKSLRAVLPNLRAENLAVSCSESPDHLLQIQERLTPSSETEFGIIMMTSGGNDLIHSYGRRPPRECAMYGATVQQALPWIDSFGQRLREMFDEIESRFPAGCEIYIANIYDPTDGVGDAISIYLPSWPDGLEIHRRYNAKIRECADERHNVFLVPMHEAFLGHGSHCRQFWRAHYDWDDPHYWYYNNIEDPNDRGYDAIRRVFLNTIVENTALRRTGGQ